MKILANDGISKTGVVAMQKAGFEIITDKVEQADLVNYINENNVNALLVRSATTVRKDIIDSCPSLKIIGRGGVGMDNIDVEYAREKGLSVINTPAASSHSVAELVFSHIFSLSRFLYDSNRQMPLNGESSFKTLKKSYAKGVELKGKTLGVIGFGRIGEATAKIGLSLGMKVIAFDPYVGKSTLELEFFDNQKVSFEINTVSKDEVLKQSDFISLHIPAQEEYVISKKEFEMMKDSAVLINAARGGVVDEVALVNALKNGQIKAAGVDVFENEPTPAITVLMDSKISLTPHIGAATLEAQDRIGEELAQQIEQIAKK